MKWFEIVNVVCNIMQLCVTVSLLFSLLFIRLEALKILSEMVTDNRKRIDKMEKQ